jgi:cell division protein FtsB
MRNKEKKKPSIRKKLLVAVLGFLLMVLLITSFFGKKGLIEIYRAQEKHEALTKEVKRLKQKKKKLAREIEELEKNPKAIERKAREELWLMRPDEIVIIKEKKGK